MTYTKPLGALAGFFFAGVSMAALAADYPASALSDGKVSVKDVSVAGQAGKTYQAGTIMAAPVDKICAVLQDYAAYPTFMPNTAKAEIVKKDGSATLVDMTLKLPLGKTKKYRLRMQPQASAKSCRLEWKLVARADLSADETIADTTGYWALESLPSDAARTVVNYHVHSDPGAVPAGLGWIVDALGKDSLPAALDALRHKVAP